MNNNKWNKNYILCQNYYHYYGNVNISCDFRTIDGINYHEEGIYLGKWLSYQIKKYLNGLLSKEQEEQLSLLDINFDESRNELNWEKNYELLLTYYNSHNHLNLSIHLKENPTLEDELEYKLARWLRYQKKLYKEGKLSLERIQKLENLGVVWDIYKNKRQKILLCEMYNINIRENELFKNISYQELYSKICFLSEMRYPIVDKGILHEVMKMSNPDLIAKYQVSIQELINRYYLKVKVI